MSDGSREFLSVEEIKERIRSRVRKATDTDASAQCGTPVSLQKESPALALHRLNRLRLNLLNVNSALGDVGALNPRPAGLVNDLLQFIKKCIRRALGWLLRPIRQFDSAAMESLDEATHILEDFQTELRSIVGRLEAMEASLNASAPASGIQAGPQANGTRLHADIDARLDLLQSKVEALARDIRDAISKRPLKS
jgi:hypothetical protein